MYNSRSKLLGIDIHVQVLPGKQGRLIEKLKAIYRKQQHMFPGTIQRYIFKDDISPTEISIWLIWKDTEMLDNATRDKELSAFQAELADVLDWRVLK